ncbi:TolC family protein [Haliangium ochraceum]|uniref:Outer membrane efflux protein n=1 Tax=Haliangium ochraceum (strain DSM 14365 / JCM 11303 / SMP-2) TaxID=502025 RepID=D0LX27_HALO1|nr:TolC family protein [Haliangium ochraceum]ACY16069.1 outer membrane efflux protein [Haliangium ochraceum DSM 14365]
MDRLPHPSIPALALWQRAADLCALALAGALAAGCANTAHHSALRGDLHAAESRLTLAPASAEAPAAPYFDGSFDGYLSYALQRHPELRAAYHDWRASVLRAAASATWPEPTLSYSYFLRSIETRLGPQRHRIGLRQELPWPAELQADSDAQEAMARAAQARFDAASLAIAERVARPYWQLWLHARMHAIHHDMRAVLLAHIEGVRARIAVGEATLGDLGQIELVLARLDDRLQSHLLSAAAARAQLAAAVAAPPGTPLPIAPDPLTIGLPRADIDELRTAAFAHPRLRGYELDARAAEARAARAHSDGYPTLALGLEYIEIGPAAQPGVDDSGRDAVSASLTLSLPLWRGAYGDEEQAAREQGMARRAEGGAARDQAAAELERALTEVRDGARRVAVYRDVLIPQAETVLGSVSGEYQTGRGSLAALLFAQRELYELQVQHARAEHDFAVAWAELEYIVGHPVERAPEETP